MNAVVNSAEDVWVKKNIRSASSCNFVEEDISETKDSINEVLSSVKATNVLIKNKGNIKSHDYDSFSSISESVEENVQMNYAMQNLNETLYTIVEEESVCESVGDDFNDLSVPSEDLISWWRKAITPLWENNNKHSPKKHTMLEVKKKHSL